MTNISLLLYGRNGCCLCEGLENHLRDLKLCELLPPLELKVIDIDHPDTPDSLRKLYQNEVPVLVLLLCIGEHVRKEHGYREI